MNEAVKVYYDNLAEDYDENRFSNSYGKFIHRQELAFLKQNITEDATCLNLGCGTGRFMEFCSHGYDISENMVKEAKTKYPNKNFKKGCASSTPYDNNTFDTIICLHVIMHLSKSETESLIQEAFRILKPGGKLIIDHPSFKRRRIFKYKAPNWHAANEYSIKMLKELTLTATTHLKTKGVLFFPIHRFPSKTRNLLYSLDQLINKSPIKEYSSYLIHSITKK